MQDTLQTFRYQDREALTVPACRENFTILQEWLTSIADTLQLSTRHRRQILTACDEIFTNAAAYAYADSPAGGNIEISVTFAPQNRELRISFRDSGAEFNPLSAADPDVAAHLAERKVGGLGLLMVKKLMDHVEYRRLDGSNILTLHKICGGEEK